MTHPQTASALLIRSDGKVLLGLRSAAKAKWSNHWDAIGGHVETNETLEAALIRELQEEIGIIPTDFRRVAALREKSAIDEESRLHYIFIVRDWEGEPSLRNDEHSEIQWFSLEEMRSLTNITYSEYLALVESERSVAASDRPVC